MNDDARLLVRVRVRVCVGGGLLISSRSLKECGALGYIGEGHESNWQEEISEIGRAHV